MRCLVARWVLVSLVLISFPPVLSGTCTDSDGDGFFREPGCGTEIDCNDGAAAIHPGAPETCDGLDNDCSGSPDDDPGCDRDCESPDRTGSTAILATQLGSNGTTSPYSAVWTGSQIGIAWEGRLGGIFFRRFSPDGVQIGDTLTLANSGKFPALVWTGNGYGLSWEESGLRLARLDANGGLLGETDVAPDSGAHSSLVWTGSEYGVA